VRYGRRKISQSGEIFENQDADITNGESSNDGRTQGNGERMLLREDSVIRELGFKNSILKQERGKVEQRSPLEGDGAA
jgi:hypothetical protein